MTRELAERRRRRLDVQGFDPVDEQRLAEVAPWLRLAFGLCASLAAVGTITASPKLLLFLSAIAVLGAAQPLHPFDLLYNVLIRRFTGTGPLPPRGAPSRFACGVGAVWLIATAWAFTRGWMLAGYLLGGALTALATLVTTTDICVASVIYRFFFGGPRRRVSECTR